MRFLFLMTLGAMALSAAEEREAINLSFAAVPKLDVSVIQGYVRVTGYSGSTIRVNGHGILQAPDSGRLTLARQEIRLEAAIVGDTLKICVQGPWRPDCKDPSRRSNSRRDDRDYSFTHNLEIQVPVNTEVQARTVNKGDVTLKNINGRFDAKNVNGPVTVEDMGSHGSAATVNGAVTARFTRAPQEAVHLKTVNGEIKAEFPKDTNANVRFKTMHGDIFTDFPTTLLQSDPASGEKRGAKYVYQSKRSSGVKIGNGGPEVTLENINGDMHITQRGQ